MSDDYRNYLTKGEKRKIAPTIQKYLKDHGVTGTISSPRRGSINFRNLDNCVNPFRTSLIITLTQGPYTFTGMDDHFIRPTLQDLDSYPFTKRQRKFLIGLQTACQESITVKLGTKNTKYQRTVSYFW